MGILRNTMESKAGSLLGVMAMALVWTFIWALPGGFIEALDNVAPAAHGFTRQVDMWMQTLGLPGLIGGVFFSALLLITERGRRLMDLSPARSGALGVVAGLMVAVLVVWVMDTGLSEPLPLAATLTGVAMLLGAVSGATAPLLFRYAAARRTRALS